MPSQYPHLFLQLHRHKHLPQLVCIKLVWEQPIRTGNGRSVSPANLELVLLEMKRHIPKHGFFGINAYKCLAVGKSACSLLRLHALICLCLSFSVITI